MILAMTRLDASSFLELNVSDVTRESRVAYRVQVSAIENLVRDEIPYRRVELQLLEVFKGRLPEESKIFVEIPGGKVDALELHISGLPQLLVDHEYILFLDQSIDEEGDYRLSNWTAYQVVTDEQGLRFVYKAPEEKDQREAQRDQLGFQALESVQLYEDFVDEIFWSQELQ